jgi:hypothetical protein
MLAFTIVANFCSTAAAQNSSKEFEHVQPRKTSADRKHEYREFAVKEQETFNTLRGGVFRVERIAADGIDVSRPKSPNDRPKAFRIQKNCGTVPIGNHEKIEVVGRDEKGRAVIIRLTTQTRMNLLEKLAF